MRRGCILAVVLCAAASSAAALDLDEARGIRVTGKVLTQVSLRMEDSDSGGRNCTFEARPGTRCTGFTFPTTEDGQLIQQRNLIDAEIFQDLVHWLGSERLWFDTVSYRFRVKYFYDGVYDYGPRAYREPDSHLQPDGQPDTVGQRGLRENRHLAKQHNPIWNAYVDVAKGPLWARVGRQDLSWGETDGFRLLDMIEPLDNRFGFPLVEDLDDRRIPLWIIRPSLRLGTWGPISNLTLDGYWVPGAADNQESPIAPMGNPFGAPAPPGMANISIPAKTMANSRGGGRILGTAFHSVTFSLAHYLTFNDMPSAQQTVRALTPEVDAPLLVDFYLQQVTGGSATFALPFDPYTIVRSEVAQFWDERVFIPEESANLADLIQEFIQGGGEPVAGSLPKRDVLRWMLGFDRNIWLRWLNPTNTFLVSMQYFHTHIFDYSRRISSALVSSVEFPEAGLPIVHTVPRKNDEVLVTYLLSTLYRHGTIIPELFGGYDSRGVNIVVPSLTYQLGTNVRFTIKYAIITGTFANLGAFRDRDQLLFRVQYDSS